MTSRKLCAGALLVFLLLLSPSGLAQTLEIPSRLNNPSDPLPQNRLEITRENQRDARLLAQLGRGSVSNLAWIDDQQVAVISGSGTWLYDLSQPEQPYAVIPGAGGGETVSVSPDGQWMSFLPTLEDRYNSGYAYFELWHIRTGQQLQLTGQTGTAELLGIPQLKDLSVMSLQWLPGNRLVTVGGRHIALWTLDPAVATVRTVVPIPPSTRTAYTIERAAFAPDSHTLALAIRAHVSDQLLVQLWDVDTREFRTLYADDLLPEQPLRTLDIQFNGDGSEVALGVAYLVEPPEGRSYFQHEIRRWDTGSGGALESYSFDCTLARFNAAFDYGLCEFPQNSNYPSGTLTAMKRLSDGSTLVEPELASLRLVPFMPPVQPQRLTLVQETLVPEDGASAFANVRVLDENGSTLASIRVDGARVYLAVISPDETHLVVADSSRHVQVAEINETARLTPLESSGGLLSGGLHTLSPDGRYLIIGEAAEGSSIGIESDYLLTVRWDIEANSYEIIPAPQRVTAVAYNPDGSTLAVGGWDGSIYVYDAETLAQQTVLLNDEAIRDLVFSHDGRVLAVASYGNIRLWDVASWEIVNRFDPRGPSVAFTADDGWLVNGDRVWKIENHGRQAAIWRAEDASEEARQIAARSGGYQGDQGIEIRTRDLIVRSIGGSIRFYEIVTEETE